MLAKYARQAGAALIQLAAIDTIDNIFDAGSHPDSLRIAAAFAQPASIHTRLSWKAAPP